MTHQARQIALSALHAPERPVRTTPAMTAAHDELVASIKAHGLLQDLVVREADDETGTFSVVAGNRRLAALRALADHGDLDADAPIACTVLATGVDDDEAALAENVVRVSMNRADQVQAFQRLIDQGATVEDIAARFGVTRKMVERRLRLAHLAPPILEAYRSGDVTDEFAQAYATTADHERQLEAYEWATGQYWNPSPGQVRDRLESARMRSTDGVAAFVGLDHYAAAGGTSEATLFEDYSVLDDPELVKRLAGEKLAVIAQGLESEWRWAEYSIEYPTWEKRNSYTELQPNALGTATEAESARMAELQDLFDQYSDLEWEDLDEDQTKLLRDAETEYQNLETAIGDRSEWSDDQKAGAGVVIFLNNDGSVGRFEGLVREGDPVPGRDDPPDDNPDRSRLAPAGDTAAGSQETTKPKAKGYSQGLRESITELRNGVLRAELCGAPDVAGDLLMFTLILSTRTGYYNDDAPNSTGISFYPDLPLSIRRETPPRLDVQGASAAIGGYLEAPRLDLPWFDPRKSVGELFESYRSLDAETKGRLTAGVVAALLFSMPGGDGTKYDAHAAIEAELQPDYAASLLDVDADLWSAETMWKRLRKDQIIDECRPCLGDEWAVGAAQLKKGELAKDAAERMKAHPAWLPKGMGAAARPEP